MWPSIAPARLEPPADEPLYRQDETTLIGALRREHGVILPRVEGLPVQARHGGEEAAALRKTLERNQLALRRGV